MRILLAIAGVHRTEQSFFYIIIMRIQTDRSECEYCWRLRKCIARSNRFFTSSLCVFRPIGRNANIKIIIQLKCVPYLKSDVQTAPAAMIQSYYMSVLPPLNTHVLLALDLHTKTPCVALTTKRYPILK